jgi:anti-sigma factor RsiW
MPGLPTDEKLMEYLDGELARDEARGVERALAGSPELRAKADAVHQLRDILQARMELAADDADDRLAEIWRGIRAGLSSAPAPRRRGLLAGVREWFETYRTHVFTAAVAAAAGAVLATFIGGNRPGRTPLPQKAEAAEVESLEVADGSATVLQIPGEGDEAATTVIWISPESSGGSPI